MRKLTLFVLPLAFFALVSCDAELKKQAETEAKNKAACEKFYGIFESGDTKELNTIITEDFKEHTPPPDMPFEGLEGMTKMIEMNKTAYPDTKIEIYKMVAEGDMVMVHYKMTGTNTGAFGPWPATNKAINVDGVDVIKINADGKATDHWGYFEEMKFMTQLGLMPEMGAAPAPADTTNEVAEVVKEVKEVVKEIKK